MFIIGIALILVALSLEFAMWTSAFSRFMYLEDLQEKLEPEVFRRVVAINPTEKALIISGAGVFVAGVVLLVLGLVKRNRTTTAA
ncbi:hypothetical protein [Crystallibacter degradans]|uniref:hypothetical protein n=1 Tax=Crystallibacter degradans TaxID=2726743 RepID=UPI001473A22D|nr:hypothetical protein [Arthrobacter sp. SF27]NMR28586.1 hypothetical protein [Arthrobacter sp. SF27]